MKGDGFRSIFLHQMACPWDGNELCPRYQGMQLPSAYNRDPFIVFAPKNLNRAADVWIEVLHVISEPLVHLRDLTVERCLFSIADPLIGIRC